MATQKTMPSKWTSEEMGDLSGKVAVVTGANSGLGREIAKRLALHGASVVMACRTVSKAETVKVEVIAELDGKGDLTVMEVDTSSFASVKKFGEAFLAQYSKLDLLMCNAGIMAVPTRELSVDGYEMQFATNHLGHFLLVGLLLPLLKKTPGSRVVVQSSGANYFGKFDWDNLNGENKYGPWDQYTMSKLANITFANELQRRLSAAGVQAPTCYSSHPGGVKTNLQSTPTQGILTSLSDAFMSVLGGTVETGSLPSLFPLTSADAEPSGFYGPNGFMEVGGAHPAKKNPNKLSQNPEMMAKLWEYSEKFTGFTYSI